MRVERRLIINAGRDAIWKVVSNPDCYPSFMPNLERWETLTEGPPGVESRYRGALEDRLDAGGRDRRGRRVRRGS